MANSRAVEWFALRALLARRGRRGRTGVPAAVLVYAPERLGARGLAILERLPRAVAVIYRGYGRQAPDALLAALVRLCRRHRRRLWVAGEASLFLQLPPGPGGRHLAGWQLRRPGVAAGGSRMRPWSAAVHDVAEARLARARKLPLALVSPVFSTTSHPEARPLGVHAFARLAKTLRQGAGPAGVLALGGMTAGRMRRLGGPADGFAAIGYWCWLAGGAGQTPSAPPFTGAGGPSRYGAAEKTRR